MPGRRKIPKNKRKRTNNNRPTKKTNTKTIEDFFPVECNGGCANGAEPREEFTQGNDQDEAGSSSPMAADPTAKSKSSRNKRRRPTSDAVWKTLKDFYPVRRSCRKPESEIKKARFEEISEALSSGEERGLAVVHHSDGGKGRGVVATRSFGRGDFVVEYRGELVDRAEADRRETRYDGDPSIGCYMYYFRYKNQPYCVDATAETRYLGRLVKHSAKEPNCVTRVVEVGGAPRLVLLAGRHIDQGEELLYDYGDRDRDAVQANPWLTNS